MTSPKSDDHESGRPTIDANCKLWLEVWVHWVRSQLGARLISRGDAENAEKNRKRSILASCLEGSAPDSRLAPIGERTRLLRGMGYHVQWIAPPGADGGIDIIADSDPLGIRGPRIKVQVRRRSDKTNIDSVRSLLALLGEGDVGLFVAIGGFTREAEEEVRRQERRRLILIDLQRLFDLWVEHQNRIPEFARRLLPIRPIYFLSLDR